ncbi:MAG TPA: DUF5666 domain-containing protein [Solirubrobacterales bacterium]
MNSRRITQILSAAAAALLALALIGASATAKSSDGTHSFHGTVSSIAKDKSAIAINTTSGSRVRFVVRGSTTYEHVNGLSGLSKGTPVEVEAFRSGDRWIAARIEANPGGSGSDDHGGHGSDDGPGDDHGSGGHGSDD